ncbi:prephenate dehydratase domain-containing protein [Candidatus Carsonella ruddii]|uniref:Putative prephenate dehydratase n=1 Tax=Candidatus Carsonella ruddii CE isolate Thao2000 TaxID=1202536 RepID=J7GZU9_CARRU|nr:prephenate dehydratase domain-containing protein [Candidatus Carsonella ruddii]AFP83530.1 putative prephenate dehydratase [Candidatus Carsonella ruddii CE isolate Thao2000]
MKKKINTKNIFYIFKLIYLKKKKKYILGPYGNYSYSLIVKKINQKYNFFSLKKIKYLFFFNKNIIPIENNNGGIVTETISEMKKLKYLFNIVFILNINHKFILLKKKKKIFFHNQTYKQSINNIKLKFNYFKKKIIDSNSIIKKGVNIINNITKKIFFLNINKITLKDNFINKTKFILKYKNLKIKKYISIFLKTINLKKIKKFIINLYKNNKYYYIEFFFFSLRNIYFNMKLIKKKNKKIIFSGYFNFL